MIECKNICKTYINGDIETQAVCGISLKIEKGEFVSIIGPSGSGKSTLMHILGALDTPTEGEYFLDGERVSEMNDDELSELRRDKIGFVFQSFNLLRRTTVLRNVMLPLLFTDTSTAEREQRAQDSSWICRTGRKQILQSFQPAFRRTDAESGHRSRPYK